MKRRTILFSKLTRVRKCIIIIVGIFFILLFVELQREGGFMMLFFFMAVYIICLMDLILKAELNFISEESPKTLREFIILTLVILIAPIIAIVLFIVVLLVILLPVIIGFVLVYIADIENYVGMFAIVMSTTLAIVTKWIEIYERKVEKEY